MRQVLTAAAPRVVSPTTATLASRTLPPAATDTAQPGEAAPPAPTAEASRADVEDSSSARPLTRAAPRVAVSATPMRQVLTEAQGKLISSLVDELARDVRAIRERAIDAINATAARLPTPRGRADELAREFVHTRVEVNNALAAMDDSGERNRAADAIVAQLHAAQATLESNMAAALDTLRTKLEHARTTKNRELANIEASRRKRQRKMNAALREFCSSGV